MMLCEAGLVDELQHGVETLRHKSLDQMTVTSSIALPRMHWLCFHSLLHCVTLQVSFRSLMETMDQAQSPGGDL